MIEGPVSQLLSAKTSHVSSVNSVSLCVYLRFRISIIVDVKLDDVPFETNVADDGKHCLIIMIGGKKILLDTDDHEKRFPYMGTLYVKGQIPHKDCCVSINNISYINVNRYMSWLRGQNFDVELLKSELNSKEFPQ